MVTFLKTSSFLISQVSDTIPSTMSSSPDVEYVGQYARTHRASFWLNLRLVSKHHKLQLNNIIKVTLYRWKLESTAGWMGPC